ncbi:MAG: M48 family metalloprotease [Nitrosomonadales bacterium]|nr:M48 family metalloprotease [Nitrosomonadales bacterium]
MSESQEINLGMRNDALVRQQYKIYPSKPLQDYVNRVGQKLAEKSHRPNLKYHYTVVDSPEINAFALPGGYVYITRGILAYLNSEAELAAVLGHETGHVTARHGVRQQSAAQAAQVGLTIASIFVPELNTNVGYNLSNLMGGALLSGYGRDHELEADRLGAEYLARTGYDPHAMIKVVGVLKNQELFDIEQAKREGREPRRYHGVFASHPDADTRLQQVVGESAHLEVAKPYEGRDAYLRQIEGVVFNDSSDQGVVRNNTFLHAELGIALSFPSSWRVQNLADKLTATAPNSEATLQMKMDPNPQGTPAEYARKLSGTGYNAPVELHDINHLPGAIVTLPTALIGVVFFDGKAFIIQSNAKTTAALEAHRQAILDCIRSFHALSEAERKQARPLSIHVITAKASDTYAKLAQESPLGKQAESYLRLINAQYPSGEPTPGQALKIVD